MLKVVHFMCVIHRKKQESAFNTTTFYSRMEKSALRIFIFTFASVLKNQPPHRHPLYAAAQLK